VGEGALLFLIHIREAVPDIELSDDTRPAIKAPRQSGNPYTNGLIDVQRQQTEQISATADEFWFYGKHVNYNTQLNFEQSIAL